MVSLRGFPSRTKRKKTYGRPVLLLGHLGYLLSRPSTGRVSQLGQLVRYEQLLFEILVMLRLLRHLNLRSMVRRSQWLGTVSNGSIPIQGAIVRRLLLLLLGIRIRGHGPGWRRLDPRSLSRRPGIREGMRFRGVHTQVRRVRGPVAHRRIEAHRNGKGTGKGKVPQYTPRGGGVANQEPKSSTLKASLVWSTRIRRNLKERRQQKKG